MTNLVINANTKIALLLKTEPRALEAIISISPKLNKLRNPILRKVMAARTSIFTASKVAGCSTEDFYKVLEPIGFIIDRKVEAAETGKTQKKVPDFIKQTDPGNTIIIDVRPIIASGSDPYSIITREIKKLPIGHVLQLINTFEPAPLIGVLSKQGFDHFVDKQSDDLVTTYFFKKGNTAPEQTPEETDSSDWNKLLSAYKDQLQMVDVRHLEMPQPMLTILSKLDELTPGKALFVYHKRIPVFLLPELQDRGYDYRFKEIAEGEVHLLIFKN